MFRGFLMEDNEAHVNDLKGLKENDPAAIERLWVSYFQRLVGLARKMLPSHVRRVTDEEDVALSVFQSFCNGAKAGQFPAINDPDDLWRLLVVITFRKARRAAPARHLEAGRGSRPGRVGIRGWGRQISARRPGGDARRGADSPVRRRGRRAMRAAPRTTGRRTAPHDRNHEDGRLYCRRNCQGAVVPAVLRRAPTASHPGGLERIDVATMSHVVLKPRRARPFFARHPWVFESSIERVAGEPSPGEPVAVQTHDGQFIARGLYNPTSTIRVRLYRWDDGPLDEEFWSAAIEASARLRHEILHIPAESSAYRLIYSEGDGLSGLTVDRYDRWLAVRFSSLALYSRRELILRLLAEASKAQGMVVRTERGIAQKEGLRAGEVMTVGTVPDDPVAIEENGLHFRVDLRAGQKTGFYLDQRVNRRAVAAYCQGKRVLDLFCFAGAFSLNALKHGGATGTLGIDSSAAAVEQARSHAALNGAAGLQFEHGDVLDVLNRLRSEGRRFGVVICDPPKFARQVEDVERALKGYLRLNLAALDVLERDGILVSCSCSGLVGRELFADLIASVAEQSGRPIQILEQRGQAPDHPISASCLETEYLKCLICRAGG